MQLQFAWACALTASNGRGERSGRNNKNSYFLQATELRWPFLLSGFWKPMFMRGSNEHERRKQEVLTRRRQNACGVAGAIFRYATARNRRLLYQCRNQFQLLNHRRKYPRCLLLQSRQRRSNPSETNAVVLRDSGKCFFKPSSPRTALRLFLFASCVDIGDFILSPVFCCGVHGDAANSVRQPVAPGHDDRSEEYSVPLRQYFYRFIPKHWEAVRMKCSL